MQMAGQTGSGDAAQIDADVETLGVQAFSINARQTGELRHTLQVFVGGHLAQLADVAARPDEQMAVVVRIAIEHDDAMLAAIGDEQLSVGVFVSVVLRCGAAQKAVVVCAGWPCDRFGQCVGRRLAAGDIFESPRCPKSIEVHLVLAEAVRRGMPNGDRRVAV